MEYPLGILSAETFALTLEAFRPSIAHFSDKTSFSVIIPRLKGLFTNNKLLFVKGTYE